MGQDSSDVPAMDSGQDHYRIAYERECEARKRAENLVEQYAQELFQAKEALNIKALETRVSHAQSQMLMSIIEYLQAKRDLESLLPKLMDNVLKVTRWPVGFYDWFDREAGERRQSSITFVNNSVRSEITLALKRARDAIARAIDFKMLECESNEYLVDLTQSGLVLASELQLQGLRYIVALPLRVHNEIHAVLYFICPDRPEDVRSAIVFLRTIMILLNFLVENKLQGDQLKSNYRQLEKTHQNLQKAQQQLIHTERLASVGSLAAGVAHEINNPVCYVKSNLGTMRQDWRLIVDELLLGNELAATVLEGKFETAMQNAKRFAELIGEHAQATILAEMDAMLADCIDGTNRVIDTVRGLKQFARPSSPQRTEVDLNHCVRNALRLTHNELKYKAIVTTDLQPLPLLWLEERSIEQVLVNLLVNSAQSIENHGEVKVTTRCVEGVVECQVQDTGCGMSEQMLKKIFDPFYTTKPVGIGTGLGLSISHTIMRAHQGDIQVESVVGEGTRFYLRFPLSK